MPSFGAIENNTGGGGGSGTVNNNTAGTPLAVYTGAGTTVGPLGTTSITGEQGNGALVQLATGASVSGDLIKYDANGNAIDAGILGTNVVTLAGSQALTNKTVSDPSNIIGLINTSGPQSPVVGTGAAANLYSFSIPGGTMGLNTAIRVTAGWIHSTGSASVSYMWSYNGSGTGFSTFASVSAAQGTSQILICNNASLSSQFIMANINTFIGASVFAPAATTRSANTAGAITVALTFTVAATDQVTPNYWMVESIH
jgi:hypothetical protein